MRKVTIYKGLFEVFHLGHLHVMEGLIKSSDSVAVVISCHDFDFGLRSKMIHESILEIPGNEKVLIMQESSFHVAVREYLRSKRTGVEEDTILCDDTHLRVVSEFEYRSTVLPDELISRDLVSSGMPVTIESAGYEFPLDLGSISSRDIVKSLRSFFKYEGSLQTWMNTKYGRMVPSGTLSVIKDNTHVFKEAR